MQRIPTKEIIPEDVDSRVFNLYEKKEKIYIRSIEGVFQYIRLFTGWPLLLGYFLAPWLQVAGRQALFFDLSQQQFHIFWLTLWPQDFVLLMWTLAIAAMALFLVTTLVIFAHVPPFGTELEYRGKHTQCDAALLQHFTKSLLFTALDHCPQAL